MSNDGRPVFQCGRTGLLYVLGDRPKHYVSVTSIKLEAAKEQSNGRRGK